MPHLPILPPSVTTIPRVDRWLWMERLWEKGS